MPTDYELVLNGMLQTAVVHKDGAQLEAYWMPDKRMGAKENSHGEKWVRIEQVPPGDGVYYPKQFWVGNLRFCFDRDQRLVRIGVGDKTRQEVCQFIVQSSTKKT